MKSIEEKYKKLSQREHILHRPDTYIGSIQSYDSVEYVLEDGIFTKRNVKTNDGLLKIFDEIVSNAVDHVFRKQEVTKIKVTIDKTTGEISVYNDGKGIPVVIHKEHGIYVPELIFSHFLSGSNYDDNEERSGAGRNGVGSKATAVFSKEFTVETVDENERKKFTQTFKDNMKVITKPKITSSKLKGYTKITFTPDYERFGLQHLTDDLYLMTEKRVYDCIASTSVSVYFNGVKIKANSFKDYISFYSKSDPIAYEKASNGWEYAVFESPESFEQVSFVNGNNTTKGGKHVDYVINQITNGVKALVKGVNVGTKIKDSLFIILKADVINPSFSSQTKDTLTSTIKKFTVGDKFIKKIYQSDITKKAIEIANFKEMKKLDVGVSLSKKSKVKVAKLDDAYNAGTSKSSKCSLILTEGDSAKTFAVAGLSVIGRENYGIFSLKGKLLNVREATQQQLLKNEEIINLKQIMGLHTGKKYTDTKLLRYSSIILLTDADCVSGDTPLLLKDGDGNVFTDTIEQITDKYVKNPLNGKEYGDCSYEIWTEKGWTGIKCVMRHKVSKTFYRVLTHTGLVDVSEDHPLLTISGKEKPTVECSVGDKLLHCFPTFCENVINIPYDLSNINLKTLWDYAIKCKIPYYQIYKKELLIKMLSNIRDSPVTQLNCTKNIDENEAYVMGLFWADGTSGVYEFKNTYKSKDRPRAYTRNRITYSWSISNNNLDFLIKAKDILSELYDLEFKIIECSTKYKNKAYKLIINGGIKTKDIVEKYTSMFYYKNDCRYKNGNKYISKEILNSSRKIRERFLEGFYNGDGNNHSLDGKGLGFCVESKISAQCVFILCKSLGYLVSINIRKDKPNVISMNITKGTQQFDSSTVKKIVNLGKIEKYVYDLETENHHFQAGVGQMIVHNCDGAHISGLVMNFIHHWWPELMEIPGFIRTIKTPIVKVSKGNQIQEFYNEFDYKEWISQVDDISKWNAKYYKGLGTSTSKESKEIFKNIKNNTRYYTSHGDKTTDKAIKLAFDKSKANDRKEWLRNVPEEYAIANSKQEISYDTFVNKELVHFSNYDNVRSIPSMVDGLKPSQRKVLYTAFKRNITKDIKVAQFGASVAEITAYHHGEVSLYGTIIGMAQNYTGAGNINLLEPIGMFGSKLSLGKDSASPRYIFTKLSQDAIKIFNPADFNILDYNQDDGNKIEPKFYTPSIPMVLVNGAIGIGTGYSTNIPHFNPDDIVKNIRLSLEDKPMETLVPWYRGFKGTITKQDDTCYIQQGCLNKINDLTLEITEIPTTTSIQSYLEFLEKNEDFETVNLSTEEEPKFILKFCSKDTLKKYAYSALKLTNKINLTNMYLFDENNTLKKYMNPNDIIKDFLKVKLRYLQRRKDYLQCKLTEELVILKNKKRFLEEIIDGKVNVYRVKKSKAIEDLTSKNYTHIDQLLSIPVSSFTDEALVSLQNKIEDTEREYIKINGKTPKQLLLDDL